MSTDLEWERWGAQDPYYGVLTNPDFRAAVMTPKAKEDFFNTGRWHVQGLMKTCRERLDPDFAPQRVLDFGCGVGRLVIPFGGMAAEVVGMDISPSMLAEAARNCEEQGATQVRLVPSDDELSAAEGLFDLVHSCIVLQHIPVARGTRIFERLVHKVAPGGIGALHVTFAWDYYRDNYGQPLPPPPKPTGLRAWWVQLQDRLRPPPPPPPPDDPEMQMNYYHLSELMFIVQQAGVTQLFVEFTDHGGAMGAYLYFRRPAAA